MLSQRNVIVSLIVALFILMVAPVSGSVIDGPVLTMPEMGWGDFGLVIRAETDVTLLSVRYPNQGLDDIIQLRRFDGTVLDSIPVPAGNRNAIVDINYPLAANEIYVLVATRPNNKYYGVPGVFSFPAGNPEVTVLGSYFGSVYNGLWFTFNDITTQVKSVELQAVIDVKPGSTNNPINLKSKGVVPVAILTTGAFDALNADLETVTFAGASPVRWQIEDLDGDGNLDVLLHFRTEELTDLSPESTEAVLTGLTVEGTPFTGIDAITIVPGK